MGGAAAGLVGALGLGSFAGKVAGTADPDTALYVEGGGRPVAVRHGADPEPLRVLDWNVRALMGVGDGQRSDDEALARIAEVVRRERPDVLMLQEVQVDQLLGGGNDDLADLAAALGARDAVLVPNGTRPNGTRKGQAILTFGETRVQDARGLAHADPHGQGVVRELVGAIGWARAAGIPLPDVGPAFHPRTTADAMITTPAGRAVRLLGVHLSGTGSPGTTGGTPGSRASQRDQLLPLVDTVDAWQGATILAGDFNVRSGTPFGDYEASVLGQAGLHDAFTQHGIAPADRTARASFQGADGRSRAPIDRVYTSRDARVVGVEVLRDEAARSASDHLPVLADIEVG